MKQLQAVSFQEVKGNDAWQDYKRSLGSWTELDSKKININNDSINNNNNRLVTNIDIPAIKVLALEFGALGKH